MQLKCVAQGKVLSYLGWIPAKQVLNDRQYLPKPTASRPQFDLFKPLRHWLDSIEVQDRKFAHSLCKLIPSQCPFERDIKVFGRTVFHIPPLCKLNPLYNEVVALRFRAMCYLADVCGEDISVYC